MKLQFHRVSKHLGDRPVLRELSVEIRSGERFFLLGASGSGKTTLLRLLAGFLQPDSGDITIGGQLANQTPPHQRPTALVFQQPALWPHLNVADNLGYGLDVRKVAGAERRQRIAEALAIVRLEGFEDRWPADLSGGQQQRVALARALVIRPSVLLMDEPLSNLDPPLRRELREELRRIHAATGVTLLYVSHDRQDALTLADRAAVLNHGRLEQVASPSELFLRPATRFVAEFLGEMNWIPGRLSGSSRAPLEIETELGLFVATEPASVPGSQVWIGIRPRHLLVGDTGTNSFSARVRSRSCLGEHDECVMEAGENIILKQHSSGPQPSPVSANVVRMSVDPQHLIVLPRD
ncbi:MAG: ABC transporter ATP-binding protein [Verrucomicrobia bacterium]|nr:ABC transporter ATP-binding protein [Verrucomicrobiota bacterium]